MAVLMLTKCFYCTFRQQKYSVWKEKRQEEEKLKQTKTYLKELWKKLALQLLFVSQSNISTTISFVKLKDYSVKGQNKMSGFYQSLVFILVFGV